MTQENLGPNIETLISEVQESLIDVQLYPAVRNRLPSLNRVELDLNTGFDKEGKLKINLFFLKVGGGASSSESQAIKLIMKPPPADANLAVAKIKIGRLATQLSKLIKAAADGVVRAGESEFPLDAKGLTVALKFGVTKKAEGEASFDIAPITLGGGGGVNVAQVQTITLVFEE